MTAIEIRQTKAFDIMSINARVEVKICLSRARLEYINRQIESYRLSKILRIPMDDYNAKRIQEINDALIEMGAGEL